jgi:hypothetical protein
MNYKDIAVLNIFFLAAEFIPRLQGPLHLRRISALRQPLKTPPSLRPELKIPALKDVETLFRLGISQGST